MCNSNAVFYTQVTWKEFVPRQDEIYRKDSLIWDDTQKGTGSNSISLYDQPHETLSMSSIQEAFGLVNYP